MFLLSSEDVSNGSDLLKIVSVLSQFGISGIILLIWWLNTKNNTTIERQAETALKLAEREADHADRVVNVVESNTKAITELSTIVKGLKA